MAEIFEQDNDAHMNIKENDMSSFQIACSRSCQGLVMPITFYFLSK